MVAYLKFVGLGIVIGVLAGLLWLSTRETEAPERAGIYPMSLNSRTFQGLEGIIETQAIVQGWDEAETTIALVKDRARQDKLKEALIRSKFADALYGWDTQVKFMRPVIARPVNRDSRDGNSPDDQGTVSHDFTPGDISKAHKLANSIHDESLRASAFFAIAAAHNELGKKDEAEKLLAEAASTASQGENKGRGMVSTVTASITGYVQLLFMSLFGVSGWFVKSIIDELGKSVGRNVGERVPAFRQLSDAIVHAAPKKQEQRILVEE